MLTILIKKFEEGEIMSRLLIYVEGDSDIIFLEKLLFHEFSVSIKKKPGRGNFEIVNNSGQNLGTISSTAGNGGSGWGNLFNNFNITQLQLNHSNRGQNLIIFDADFSSNNGGFKARLKELNRKKQKHRLVFEMFLFPNHKNDGMLETLERDILLPKYTPILKCRESMYNCLQAMKGIDIHVPPKHILEKEAIRNLRKDTKQKKNYSDMWDLNASVLGELKKFLTPFFTRK